MAEPDRLPHLLERLTPTADETLALAEQEAALAGALSVETEHALLALLAVRGVASVVLKQSGASDEGVRAFLETERGTQRRSIASQLKRVLARSLGPRRIRAGDELEKILMRADEAARELGHPRIGTEHLLWALVEHAQGPTARYLMTIDLTPEQARRRILEMLRVANAALNDQRATPAPAASQKRKTPALDAFTSDLVRRARKGKLPKLVRRLADADRVKAGLLRLARRNVLIVGDQGSGKTSLVQTLAKEIALDVVPDALRGRRIRQLDPVLLVAGTKYRGQYEERVAALLDETIQTDTILFLDDLQLLALPGGAYSRRSATASSADLMRLLQPAFDRGEIQMIATCSRHAAPRMLEQFPCLASAFHRVEIESPDPLLTRAIVTKKLGSFVEHAARCGLESLVIDPSVVPTVLTIAELDPTPRSLVVRALDALDRAIARAVLRRAVDGVTIRVIDETTFLELLGVARRDGFVIADGARDHA